jgi:AcrR family transcriptional regulator
VPRLLDSYERRRELTHAVTVLVANGGLAAVSMRSVAAELRMSVAGLAHQVTRDELLAVAALEHGSDMVDRIVEVSPDRQLAAFVPVECRAEPGRETTDPEWDSNPYATFRPFGVLQTRVWLTWCNLAMTHPVVADAVEDVRQRQLLVLADLMPSGAVLRGDADAHADALLALVDGLRLATCRSVDPMPLDAARHTLLRAFERTFVQNAACPTGPPAAGAGPARTTRARPGR